MDLKRWRLAAWLALPIAAAVLASPARGADRILWGNNNGSTISFANLDGSGAGDIFGAAENAAGLAIDSTTGRLYYTNEGGSTIGFINLAGGGGGTLDTGSATVKAPDGLAIDPVSRRIYWANDSFPGAISFANLDGGGGADLNTSGATVMGPSGVAVDLATRRLYWANYNEPSISFANLDGSGGGGNLPTPGIEPGGPAGVAIDPGARKIYWTQTGGIGIGVANLDGSGGSLLATPGATTAAPWGLALDPSVGRAYWANNAGSLAMAALNGSGGGPISTTGATVEGPDFPVLQKAPSGTGAPTIAGSSAINSTLSCSRGSWTEDVFEAHLYQAPQAFSYKWSREGADIGGATADALKATKPGSYTCTVTGSNPAGSASQTSGAHLVGPPDFITALFDGKSLYVRLKCPARFKPGCLGTAVGTTVKQRCTRSGGRRHCRPGAAITAAVSAKQKPTKWKVATLKVKSKFKKTVAQMAKHPSKKLLYVRQTIHAKGFAKGRPQAVFHIYRVRKISAK
jgi:hypothetical protein